MGLFAMYVDKLIANVNVCEHDSTQEDFWKTIRTFIFLANERYKQYKFKNTKNGNFTKL
jgi:hypothetical protein